MTWHLRWGLLAALLLLAVPARAADRVVPAHAADRVVAVQGSDQDGFGRVLFDVAPHDGDRLRRDGDRVIVTLGAGGNIGALTGAARNVRALRGGKGRAVLTVARGAELRLSRVDDKLALDVLDAPAGADVPATAEQRLPVPPVPPMPSPQPVPSPASQPAPPAAPLAVSPAGRLVGEPSARAIASLDMPKAVPGPAASAAPVGEWPTGADRPPELAARPVNALPDAAEAGFLVPFEPGVGVAAFRRPGAAYVVFDQRRAIDLAPLRDRPALAGASIQLLRAATLLRVPLGPDDTLAVARTPAGWSVSRRAAAAEAIRVRHDQGGLAFAANGPGGVVVLTDPDTGGPLLVGTQQKEGQGMVGHRLLPGFALPPTWVGVVVEAQADALSLRAGKDGFVLRGGPDGLALDVDEDGAERVAAAETRTRRFDFPARDVPALLNRLRALAAGAAGMPPLARGAGRRELAQGMIALGLAAEAQTVLQTAATDDPREAETAEHAGLSGIAAVLAGRYGEATGLDDRRLDGSDEILLWRAVRAAARQPMAVPEAATTAAFAANLPLLLAYPVPLRERLLPLAAEALLAGGEVEAARKLLAHAGELPGLAYAHALLAQAEGDADKAIAALEAVAAGRDRWQRARAAARLMEARLGTGEATPLQTAEALEKLISAWRGDRFEQALRLRAAELYGQAGAGRQALALLRDTETQFPEEAGAIRARMRGLVAEILRGEVLATLPPLDLVALVDENADLLPEDEAGAELTARLVERLAALDLPKRATPLLRKLMTRAPAGPARARYGASLAALRLQEADAPGALAALAESGAGNLPAALAEERTILSARATARAGDVRAAATLLAGLDSDAALAAGAAIHEEARDWPRAAEALDKLLTRALPAEGALDDRQQRAVLRLATAAMQAGDAGLLGRLRAAQGPRMPAGAVGDLFRLLTAESAEGVADLPRTARELALARAISTEGPRR